MAGRRPEWDDRGHFFGILSKLMRQILTQHARKRAAKKRMDAGDVQTLKEDVLMAPGEPRHLLFLDEALTRLERLDPRQCQIVELRYFAGLTVTETAVALECSTSTVKREWRIARAWLYRELKSRQAL